MCIAVVVYNHVRKKDVLKMARANPDGGGIAWVEDGIVRYEKGLDAKSAYRLARTLPTPYLLHFRLASVGPSVPHLTHPFAVGASAYSRAVHGTCQKAIVHNGTWLDYARHLPEHAPRDTSDTQTAAYLAGSDESVLSRLGLVASIEAGETEPRVMLWGEWKRCASSGNYYSNYYWRYYRRPKRRASAVPDGQGYSYRDGKWVGEGSSLGSGYAYGSAWSEYLTQTRDAPDDARRVWLWDDYQGGWGE